MSDDGIGSSQTAGAEQGCQSESGAFLSPDEKLDTQVTCDVLCSLSASYPQRSAAAEEDSTESGREKRKAKACPKQHQLPLFLSRKYHNMLTLWVGLIQDPTHTCH